MAAERGWQRKFDDPILLPDGQTLVTLRDAAAFITGLPKKEAARPEWQAAIEALMLVAERTGHDAYAYRYYAGAEPAALSACLIRTAKTHIGETVTGVADELGGTVGRVEVGLAVTSASGPMMVRSIENCAQLIQLLDSIRLG